MLLGRHEASWMCHARGYLFYSLLFCIGRSLSCSHRFAFRSNCCCPLALKLWILHMRLLDFCTSACRTQKAWLKWPCHLDFWTRSVRKKNRFEANDSACKTSNQQSSWCSSDPSSTFFHSRGVVFRSQGLDRSHSSLTSHSPSHWISSSSSLALNTRLHR